MNRSYSLHSGFISALFVLGNSVLVFPSYSANEYTFLAFLTALLFLAVVFLISGLLWDKIAVGNKWLYLFFLCVISVFALFSAANAFEDITRFLAEIVLPGTYRFFIAVLLAGVIIYFSLKKQENILKFSLLMGTLVFIIIAFFLVASSANYNTRNIFVFRLPSLKNAIGQIKPYFLGFVAEASLIPIYLRFTLNRYNKKTAFAGAVAGGCLLGLCILASILLFGVETASSLEFPFSSAVSTVTVGRLFTRLDGLIYFVNFVCGSIKITVCLFTVKSSLEAINKIIRGCAR